MGEVHMTIDDRELVVAEGTTILEAARANGIHIPTLCYMKELTPQASCRMCVVQVEGMRTFQPSCATKVREGMVIHTNTEEVRANRKLTLQLIMAHHPVDCHHCLRIGSSTVDNLDPKFCEMCFFCDCVRDGICELQALNREYKVDRLPFEIDGYRYPVDDSLHSIVRDANKCVKCRRCVEVCNGVQTVHNLQLFGRGQDYRVVASLGKPMAESKCVRCGRCVDVCPTGALHMEDKSQALLHYTHSYDTPTIGMASQSVCGGVEELYGMEKGTLDLRKLVAALKKLNVDAVISEEQVAGVNAKMAEEIISKSDGPIVISNSFAVRNFVKLHFPQLEEKITWYDSMQETFSKMAKELAQKQGMKVEELKTIVFTAGNENSAEAQERGTVDFSVNAKDLRRLFKRTGVDPCQIQPVDPLKWELNPELTFSTAVGPVAFNYDEVPEVDWVMGKTVAIAHNLGQTRRLLEQLAAGTSTYDVIRLSA